MLTLIAHCTLLHIAQSACVYQLRALIETHKLIVQCDILITSEI